MTETTLLSTDQVVAGLGLGLIIVVLAVGWQVLGSRLPVRALIILRPEGFAAGAIASDVDPDRLVGQPSEPLVMLGDSGERL